jgi:hypothetical protein
MALKLRNINALDTIRQSQLTLQEILKLPNTSQMQTRMIPEGAEAETNMNQRVKQVVTTISSDLLPPVRQASKITIPTSWSPPPMTRNQGDEASTLEERANTTDQLVHGPAEGVGTQSVENNYRLLQLADAAEWSANANVLSTRDAQIAATATVVLDKMNLPKSLLTPDSKTKILIRYRPYKPRKEKPLEMETNQEEISEPLDLTNYGDPEEKTLVIDEGTDTGLNTEKGRPDQGVKPVTNDGQLLQSVDRAPYATRSVSSKPAEKEGIPKVVIDLKELRRIAKKSEEKRDEYVNRKRKMKNK